MSSVEITVNLVLGLILSTFIFNPLVLSLYDLEIETTESFSMALIFTAISWLRSYMIRRVFNGIK